MAYDALMHWARRPGDFRNKRTGAPVRIPEGSIGPMFTGSVREWYETLMETLIDVVNDLHVKVANERGKAWDRRAVVRCNDEVYSLIESSVLYKPTSTLARREGTLAGMTVTLDPSLPRERIEVDATFTVSQEGDTASGTGAVQVDWCG